jgi:hypothetical protein
MELLPNVFNDLLHGAAMDLAFLQLAGAPVKDLLPLRFGVGIHGVVQAGNKAAHQERPVLRWPSQHFSHFLGSDAHTVNIGVECFPGKLSELFLLLARMELGVSLL